MKTTVFVLIIALLLSIAGNVYFFKKEKAYKEQSDSYFAEIEQRIKEHTAWTELAQGKIDSIHSKRLADSLLFKSREKGLELRVATLKKTIATLRHEVSVQVDSLPLVKEFIAIQDSTIQKQDSLNVALTGQIFDQAVSFNAELEQEREKFHEQVKNTEDFKQVAENAIKLYEKQKRKKFSIGVSGGYSVVSTGGEVRTGPAIQVGIVYNLWRF